MMIRLLTLCLMLFLVPADASASGGTWLVLRMKGGSTQSYLIPGSMRVVADGDSLRIVSERMEVAYSTDRVVGYHFASDDDVPSAIGEVMAEGVMVRHRADDDIVLSGLAADSTVRVYGVNGVQHTGRCRQEGDCVVVTLQGLPPGTYIIKAEGIEAVKVTH